jgi:hypothetical protein
MTRRTNVEHHERTALREVFLCFGSAPTIRQIVSGFNFLVNAPDFRGISLAVIHVDHQHAGAAQRKMALIAANIVRTQLVKYYDECLYSTPYQEVKIHATTPVQSPKAHMRTGLICELFAIYLICRVRSSWSVLEMSNNKGILLEGMRFNAQMDCAEAWANGILLETGLMNTQCETFMKMCVSGAVGCLTYCRKNAPTEDEFWHKCDSLFDDLAECVK